MTSFADLVISLKLALAGLRLGLKNRQVSEKWVSDDCSYLCKGLYIKAENAIKNCLINSIPLSICGLFWFTMV